VAYINANPHKETPTRVVCDACAEKGEVPFRATRVDVEPRHTRPWRWFKRHDGNCDKCGADC
jgi:hypothetical protein